MFSKKKPKPHTIVYSGFSHFCFWQCSDSRLTGSFPVHDEPPIISLTVGFLEGSDSLFEADAAFCGDFSAAACACLLPGFGPPRAPPFDFGPILVNSSQFNVKNRSCRAAGGSTVGGQQMSEPCPEETLLNRCGIVRCPIPEVDLVVSTVQYFIDNGCGRRGPSESNKHRTRGSL
jgi:hypothetical protein